MSPGAMHSVDIVLTQKGTWKLSCNVMGHGTDGISAMYSVSASPPSMHIAEVLCELNCDFLPTVNCDFFTL